MKERIKRGIPTKQWMEQEKQKILNKEASPQVLHMYAGTFALSKRFTEDFRKFWNLPGDWLVYEDELNISIYGTHGAWYKEDPNITLRDTRRCWSMASYDRQTIEELIDGTLEWFRIKEMMSSHKDPDRFETYLSILQDRVLWDETIILPAGLHLYIVQKPNGDRIVKCECGHEFCDDQDNWKLHALIYVRDDVEKMNEVYPFDFDWGKRDRRGRRYGKHVPSPLLT